MVLWTHFPAWLLAVKIKYHEVKSSGDDRKPKKKPGVEKI